MTDLARLDALAAAGLREALERLLRQRARGGQGWGFNADMHEKDVVTAILALPEVAALLDSDKPGLDTAWAEAEAALPEGWRVFQIEWPTDHDDEWVARAAGNRGQGMQATGPTPEAALRALAARLAATEEGGGGA